MKYSELHRKIIQAGWKFNHAAGSHYYYPKSVIRLWGDCPLVSCSMLLA